MVLKGTVCKGGRVGKSFKDCDLNTERKKKKDIASAILAFSTYLNFFSLSLFNFNYSTLDSYCSPSCPAASLAFTYYYKSIFCHISTAVTA